MRTLVLIGLVGGLITGISPCILPELPIVFFAAARRSRGVSPREFPPRAHQRQPTTGCLQDRVWSAVTVVLSRRLAEGFRGDRRHRPRPGYRP